MRPEPGHTNPECPRRIRDDRPCSQARPFWRAHRPSASSRWQPLAATPRGSIHVGPTPSGTASPNYRPCRFIRRRAPHCRHHRSAARRPRRRYSDRPQELPRARDTWSAKAAEFTDHFAVYAEPRAETSKLSLRGFRVLLGRLRRGHPDASGRGPRGGRAATLRVSQMAPEKLLMRRWRFHPKRGSSLLPSCSRAWKTDRARTGPRPGSKNAMRASRQPTPAPNLQYRGMRRTLACAPAWHNGDANPSPAAACRGGAGERDGLVRDPLGSLKALERCGADFET